VVPAPGASNIVSVSGGPALAATPYPNVPAKMVSATDLLIEDDMAVALGCK
jgi:hypothetical protein